MINKGSQVQVKDNSVGTVLDVKNGFAMVNVNSQSSWHPINDLVDMSDHLLSRLSKNDTDSPLQFILAIDAHRLMTKYRFDPYVLASSTKITIYPHQIDEVIWGIDNQRIMIADEVGLGKTIIAALIASEIEARGLADKVLYVVPKSLVLKWQDELETKFDTKVDLLDSTYIKVNSDPFSTDKYRYVTSMDFLKQDNRRRLIKRLDLVVIDEVHKFKPGNERYIMGEILSKKANFMIFLTATPHDGVKDNFLGRMKLLDPFVASVPATTRLWSRHVKEQVVDIDGKQVFPKRTSYTVNTELTNNERNIHHMLDRYIRDRATMGNNKQNRAIHLLGAILRKRATSSLYALRNTLVRRKKNLGKTAIQEVIDPDDMENDEDYEDYADKYEYVFAGTDMEQEKRNISDMIRAIDEIKGIDSKFDELLSCITQVKSGDTRAKILLFTEYRDTLEYLKDKLSKKYSVDKIDGTMDMIHRKNVLEEFSQVDGPEILLCTDAAGEGVDMQFCNIEFNYDIPWNPNRLEQRMGRIHRIGQMRNVRYYNFVVDKDNTIDGMIHGMLQDKINSIKDAMGSDAIFDILGRIISEDMFSKLYAELQKLPKDMWKPKIMEKMETIEKTRKDIKRKADWLLSGHVLDRTMFEDIDSIKVHAVDSSDVRRFLETYVESNDGRYKENGGMVRIRPPRHLMTKIKYDMNGTLDKVVAQKRNIEYLALGNKKVQIMLEDAIKNGNVASLGHEKKGGLLCVYNRSVIDGDGHKRNSETVTIFCNEDGVANVVNTDSIWDYEGVEPEYAKPPNAHLIARLKELADEEISKNSKEFYTKTVDNMKKMRRRAFDSVDASVSEEVKMQDEKIREWESKRHSAPYYDKLINDANNKRRKKKEEGDNRKAELNRRFETRLQIELIGLATITPKAEANARTTSDRKGMVIVMEKERQRAKTEEEQNQVLDVSGRDTGYDVETKDRFIEVKSFEGSAGCPSMTSHEWQTAKRLGEEYWLYVVENVHTSGHVTEIQNPAKTLHDIINKKQSVTYTYSFNWAAWKKRNTGIPRDKNT